MSSNQPESLHAARQRARWLRAFAWIVPITIFLVILGMLAGGLRCFGASGSPQRALDTTAQGALDATVPGSLRLVVPPTAVRETRAILLRVDGPAAEASCFDGIAPVRAHLIPDSLIVPEAPRVSVWIVLSFSNLTTAGLTAEEVPEELK